MTIKEVWLKKKKKKKFALVSLLQETGVADHTIEEQLTACCTEPGIHRDDGPLLWWEHQAKSGPWMMRLNH